ncbi:MAG: hypothetical protein MUE53_05665, partial [Chitinophagales bacterium]|nr:hypothetical protein [Chitinophagales bacterium]
EKRNSIKSTVHDSGSYATHFLIQKIKKDKKIWQKGFYFLSLCMIFKDFGFYFTRPTAILRVVFKCKEKTV